MKLIMDNSWTTIDYEQDNYLKDRVDKALHEALGIKKEGYQYSPAYKRRVWDGITPFYDKELQRFPTGLIHDANACLGNMQNKLNFTYEIVDDRPEPLLTVNDLPEEITLRNGEMVLRDYQYESIKKIVELRNGILHLSTNSGKSATAMGLVKQVIPKLEKGETIGIFTHSKDIFTQLHKEFEKNLGIKIGKVGSGTRTIKQVNIIMTPTVAAAMKVDLEAKLKLTAKETIIKKVAKLAPQFLKGVNQKLLMQNYVNNFKINSKADQNFIAELESIIYTSESDAKIKFKLNGYIAKYQKILEEKNKDKYKKKKEMQEFLDSVVMSVHDEGHHVSGDGYYNTVLGCENALIKVGLTGSIDEKDNFQLQRLKSAFHNIAYRVRNKDMIERGVSATPTILMTPIDKVLNAKGEEVDVLNNNNYMDSYQKGIVDNAYRNSLVAKMTEMWYNKGKGVLVIVQRIDHGTQIEDLLKQLNVPCEFVHGGLKDEDRNDNIQAMKDGNLKVLISSTILDEGVDISGIDIMLMTSSGKSLRQTLQRVGRGLRRKDYGDNTLTVIDFYDRTNKFLKKHSEERLAIYEEEEFEIKFLEK